MIKIKDICDFLANNNIQFNVKGDVNKYVRCPCSIFNPKPFGLTYFARKKWDHKITSLEEVVCVILPEDFPNEELPKNVNVTRIFVENSRLVFIMIVSQFFEVSNIAKINSKAEIHETVTLGRNVSIGAYTVVGQGSIIGDNTIIESNVTIGSKVKIGSDCSIGPGSAIGQPGFGYERNEDGVLVQFPHLGGVVIGNGVHIGANTCIDRGTLDDTIIGNRARIDNLCHISHNTNIGEDTAIIANSMIGGSVNVGSQAWLAPSSSIINGVTIAQKSQIGMGSVVVKPVMENETVLGTPARSMENFRKLQKALKAFSEAEDEKRSKKDV